jgi:hypothetical protein
VGRDQVKFEENIRRCNDLNASENVDVPILCFPHLLQKGCLCLCLCCCLCLCLCLCLCHCLCDCLCLCLCLSLCLCRCLCLLSVTVESRARGYFTNITGLSWRSPKQQRADAKSLHFNDGALPHLWCKSVSSKPKHSNKKHPKNGFPGASFLILRAAAAAPVLHIHFRALAD